MGELAVGIIGFVPLFILFKNFYIYYKDNIKDKIAKLKIVKILSSLPIINFFLKSKKM